MRERDAVRAVLRGVRTKPHLTNVPMVVVVEGQLGAASSYMASHFQEDPLACVMYECKGGREGVPANDETLYAMKHEFECALAAGAVRFADDLVTYGRTPEETRRMYVQMMRNTEYRQRGARASDEAAEERGVPRRFTITGKKNGMPDDMFVSSELPLYWRHAFWRSDNPRYTQMRSLIALRDAE